MLRREIASLSKDEAELILGQHRAQATGDALGKAVICDLPLNIVRRWLKHLSASL